MDPNKPLDDTINIEDIRDKSMREIALEEQQQAIAEEVTPPVIDTPTEPTAEEVEAKRVAAEEAQRAHDAEVAKRAADEVIKAQKEEETKQLEARAKEEERKRREASLKPSWQNDPDRPKDDNGNPLPKSYDEIVEETARITREQVLAEIEDREAKRLAQQQETQQGEEARKAEIERINTERETYLNNQIEQDLNDLYSTGKLTRIEDPNNPNDPGILERNALFEAGAKLNQKLIAEGKPAVSSLKLIYYEHYKAPTAPAGANAPVAGNTPPTSSDVPDDEYDYARDHFKSPRELLMEQRRRASRS